MVIGKSVLTFAVLIILTKAIGRKLLSQMTVFDFVIAITIGNIAATFVVTNINERFILV